jgi:uncharacterized protein
MIIRQTYHFLKTQCGNRFDNLSISDIRIGRCLTAVRLSDNSCGVSATLFDEHSHCAKSERDYGDFTPLKIKGQRVRDLFESGKESNTILTLKIAVLNAFSSAIIASGKYKIVENTDPIDLLDLTGGKTITIVGAFHSYIQKVGTTKNKLHVLELNEKALTPEQSQYYVPANEYRSVLPGSDIVIITGLTLVNETIDGLLSAIEKKTEVVVTGPSSSIIPDILFENKVDIIGATQITQPDILFDVISEGGTGYHLFKYCARKICILKNGKE